MFTEKQLEEFDELTRKASSYDQMERIEARVDYPIWQKENGLTKQDCDAMMEELKKRGRW